MQRPPLWRGEAVRKRGDSIAAEGPACDMLEQIVCAFFQCIRSVAPDLTSGFLRPGERGVTSGLAVPE